MTIILDSDTERLARRLAKRHGVSVEQAVGVALRAELARAEQAAEPVLAPARQALVDRTMAMVAALPPLPADAMDPTADLYDDQGLPR